MKNRLRLLLPCVVLSAGLLLVLTVVLSPSPTSGCSGLSGNFSRCVSIGPPTIDPTPYLFVAGLVGLATGAVWLVLVVRASRIASPA